MEYGDIDPDQHWLRQWIVADRHQTIDWTDVDVSFMRFCYNHLRAISQEIQQQSFIKISLKITYRKIYLNLQGIKPEIGLQLETTLQF